MDANKNAGFTLGDVRVSPSHNELVAFNKTIKLQPKVMAVLYYLACNHTRVISNEELIKCLWEGRIVTHSSVQKSINSLRSALSELMGEREVIAHYSKRGYQLKVDPHFLSDSVPDLPPIEVSVDVLVAKPWYWSRGVLGLGLGCVIFVFVLLYGLTKTQNITLDKTHKTTFHSAVGYTNETGHERNAMPHPNNNHVVYIREKFNANHLGETESEIIVRNNAGKDWRIASSHGSWFKLAWSPSGKSLVAVEVKRQEGLPFSPNFYEKPNYLYSFHIFLLDLNNEQILEKQLLSQWQGRIFSVTWWDENILEFVAKQGANSVSARYRYFTQDQHLTVLDELEGAANLVASAVQNKKTALASLHKNTVQIDFLNENQSSIGRWQLNYPAVDISWIPDGSGILVYSEGERRLSTLYLDGQQVEIPFSDTKDSVFSRPRYRPDGAAIFYTEEKRSSNVLMLKLNGTKTQLTKNTVLNYAATFSPNGKGVVYASVRNNQTHLWLVEGGVERQLTNQSIAKKVSAIIWSKNEKSLIYSSGGSLFQYVFSTAETALVLSDANKVEPVAYFPEVNKLLMLKSGGEIKNLWRIDLQSKQQKQLTFGSVGSAVEYGGDIFFQYAGEKGLWVLRGLNDIIEQVAPTLPENSKLLAADKIGIYFIGGGVCRESDIYFWDYASASTSTFLVRDTNIVSTTSFNAKEGVLQTECYLAESNIVLLK